MALELTRWREDIAQREDRHVRWILPDPAIVEIARRQPTKLGQLGDIRGVKGSSVRRLGPEILDVVRRGREAPPLKLDRVRAEIHPTRRARWLRWPRRSCGPGHMRQSLPTA